MSKRRRAPAKPQIQALTVGGVTYPPAKHGVLVTELERGNVTLVGSDWHFVAAALGDGAKYDGRLALAVAKTEDGRLHGMCADRFVRFCYRARVMQPVAEIYLAKNGVLPVWMRAFLQLSKFTVGGDEIVDAGAVLLEHTALPLRVGINSLNPRGDSQQSMQMLVRAATLGRLQIEDIEERKEHRWALSERNEPTENDCGYILGTVYYCMALLAHTFDDRWERDSQHGAGAWMLSLPFSLRTLYNFLQQQFRLKRALSVQLDRQRRALEAARELNDDLSACDALLVNCGVKVEGKPATLSAKCVQSIELRITSTDTVRFWTGIVSTVFAKTLSYTFTMTVVALYLWARQTRLGADLSVYVMADLLELVNHTSLALYTSRADVVRAITAVCHSCAKIYENRAPVTATASAQTKKRKRKK